MTFPQLQPPPDKVKGFPGWPAPGRAVPTGSVATFGCGHVPLEILAIKRSSPRSTVQPSIRDVHEKDGCEQGMDSNAT